MTPLALVDYGASNIKSIVRGLERAGARVSVATHPADLEGAAGLVLPGVGAAGAAMRGLRERGLIDPLCAALRRGTPFLGVCLGMHLLLETLEEDDATGLGLIGGRVRRLEGVKVPHMGWNTVAAVAGNEGPLAGLPPRTYCYFVHSYVVELAPGHESVAAGMTDYGGRFVAALARENIWGVQFHPEKSGAAGAHVLRTFVGRCGAEMA